MKRAAKTELLDMGIDLRDVEQPIGTLSDGERQSVAIAYPVGDHFIVLNRGRSLAAVGQQLEAEAHELGIGTPVGGA